MKDKANLLCYRTEGIPVTCTTIRNILKKEKKQVTKLEMILDVGIGEKGKERTQDF